LNSLSYLKIGKKLLVRPVVGVKWHELDESYFDWPVLNEFDKIVQLLKQRSNMNMYIIVEALHDDHIDLD